MELTAKEAIKTASFWKVAAFHGLRNIPYAGVNVHFVPLLVWKGLDESTAAFLLGLMSFSAVVARPLTGWLGDRWSKQKIAATGVFLGGVGLGVLLWAIFTDGGSARWWVLGIASVLAFIGLIMRFAGPWRALRRTGVPVRSIVVGGLFGIVGFFVIPVIGLVLGFILGVYIAEWVRLARASDAWPSTKTALRAVGVVLLLELFLALVIAVVWVVGVFIA